jgi:hypothetical protein
MSDASGPSVKPRTLPSERVPVELTVPHISKSKRKFRLRSLTIKRILAIILLCTTVAPAALMSLNMLIETVGGRNYTAAELRAWLEDIGYRDVRAVCFEGTGANGVVIGYKPK